jgi:hypothetical protein
MRKILIAVPLLLIAVSALALTASFSFYQEDLSQAFLDISTQFNVPIVVDESVSGQVTMNLNDVTLDEAMNLLCKKAGLFYFEKNGVYFVGSSSSPEMMKMYGYKTRIIPLNYLDPKGAMAFLSPYSNYISYASGEPLLIFFGPDGIYKKVLDTLKTVDVETPKMYVTYTVYEVTDESWQNGGHNLAMIGKLQQNEFKSVDFKDFFFERKSMNFESYGFAKVNVGKTAAFSVQDLGLSIKMQLLSYASNRAEVSIDLSSVGDSSLNVSSRMSLLKGKIALCKMKARGKTFLVEVSVVKPAPQMLTFAKIWPKEEKESDFSFMTRGYLMYGVFEMIGRYRKFAVSIDRSDFSLPFDVYAGISEKFAENLYGYLFVGVTLPATSFESISTYTVKLMAVQTPKKSEMILSSGYVSLQMPLDFSSMKIDYAGNLEFEIGNLLIGGSVEYHHTHSEQKFVPYLSAGLVFGPKAFGRVLYSPTTKAFKGEIDVEM